MLTAVVLRSHCEPAEQTIMPRERAWDRYTVGKATDIHMSSGGLHSDLVSALPRLSRRCGGKYGLRC